MINYQKCDIRFSESFSLKDINWQVNAGEAWAIIGPNGSGKSALAASIAGEGEILVGECRIDTAKTGLVSLEEQSRLIERERQRDDSDLTDVVSDGTPVSEMLDEVCQAPDLKDQLIETFSLAPLLARGFRKLSTGETRKVLFTRALISDPSLLILDEPFEGLDVVTVPKVQAMLAELASRTTMIMVLNRIDEIPDFVTHVLRLEDGRITQQLDSTSGADIRQTLAQISSIRSADIEIPPPEDVRDTPRNADGSLVSLRNVRVAYTDNLVFENVNWVIQPGQHWQVKGPNGSGKTCLLNLVTGDHPQCYVNDIALFGYQRGQGESIWQIKQYMGFVSTALHWDYRLSVSVRNVIVSGFYDSIGLYQKATEKQLQIADDWLRLLGLEGKKQASFSSLSYGEQRVLLIARAMVKHPALLLLDEPCLGLDQANRELVLALTTRICDEGSTTIVYVTHHQEDRIPGIENELVLG